MRNSIGPLRRVLAAGAACALLAWSPPTLAQREPGPPVVQTPSRPAPAVGNREPSGPALSAPPQSSQPSQPSAQPSAQLPSSGGGSRARPRPRDDNRHDDYGHRDYDREDWRYRQDRRYRLYDPYPRRLVEPYPYPYYYVEPRTTPDPYYNPPPQGVPGTYYYCYDPAGYYPDVQNCPGGWVAVQPPG
ncbi:MAG: hypothetical protein IT562_19600 [Alphaproteobacteria bacterium]|nr:hypothetical protein [Alphaproteobacteria bacterium]